MLNPKKKWAATVEREMTVLAKPLYSIRKTVQLEARIVELEMSLAEAIALAEKNHEIAIRWKTDALNQCEECKSCEWEDWLERSGQPLTQFQARVREMRQIGHREGLWRIAGEANDH